MKLPLQTRLEDALRLANQEGGWIIRGKGSSDELEREICEDLKLLCGIKTLTDLKRDFDSGSFAWRNSEAGSEICHLAYLFELISLEELEKAIVFLRWCIVD